MIRVLLSALCSLQRRLSYLVTRRPEIWDCALTGWGMTEIGCGVMRSFLDAPEDDRCLASGCALPGYEGTVMNPETGAPVPSGTVGELWVWGYSVMQGYYKQPE